MMRWLALVLTLAVTLAVATPALAQDTLEKIKTSGVLTIGTRTGSPPFAYVNKDNQWVGFTIDLVDMLVKPSIEKAVGKSIKVEKKESTPPTRIPLLSSNAVDLIAGTMTDTPQRRESVDIIREKYPQAQLREFPDQPAAFQALLQGQVDAYTNDGIQLFGLKAKAPKPDEWDVVGDFYSEEPYGMAMRKGDAKFKAAVDAGLKSGLESGKYFEIYEKWFGPKGELPYPMTPQVKTYLMKQIGK
jgi:ABC-type amino acid transport substrate-binding protein